MSSTFPSGKTGFRELSVRVRGYYRCQFDNILKRSFWNEVIDKSSYAFCPYAWLFFLGCRKSATKSLPEAISQPFFFGYRNVSQLTFTNFSRKGNGWEDAFNLNYTFSSLRWYFLFHFLWINTCILLIQLACIGWTSESSGKHFVRKSLVALFLGVTIGREVLNSQLILGTAIIIFLTITL